MPDEFVQDDVRENRLVDLFNLSRPANRVRHGTDALLRLDGIEYEFELKSVSRAKGGISTVRDLGPDHISKWAEQHWIIAFFESGRLKYCRYGSPDHMAPWIKQKWEYIRADFEMAKYVPDHITLETMYEILGIKETYTKADAKRLHKNQLSAAKYAELMDVEDGYSPPRMLEIFKDRARYVIERGSTLNNPHISPGFIATWPLIEEDHALRLRELVREWVAAGRSEPPEPDYTP
jgi:hypothetical protein